MLKPYVWLPLCTLAIALGACRSESPNAATDPDNLPAAVTDSSPGRRNTRLASFCRIVKVTEGEVPSVEKSLFTLDEAPEFNGDLAASATAIVRDTPDIQYDIVGRLPQPDAELAAADTIALNDTELVLCAYETNLADDSETCWYLNEEGWYGALTSYGTQAQLYLMEAKTLDLVATTRLTRPRKSCPESYTLAGDSREEIRNGEPISEQQIRQWLQSLN